MEQNSQAQFNYELLADGEVNRTLVPPLLFIPFVQYIVKSINEQRTSIPVSLKIHLKVEEEHNYIHLSLPTSESFGR